MIAYSFCVTLLWSAHLVARSSSGRCTFCAIPLRRRSSAAKVIHYIMICAVQRALLLFAFAIHMNSVEHSSDFFY